MKFMELLKVVPSHYGIRVKVLVKRGHFYSVFGRKENVTKPYLDCDVIKFEILLGGVIDVVVKDTEDFKEEEKLDFPNG